MQAEIGGKEGEFTCRYGQCIRRTLSQEVGFFAERASSLGNCGRDPASPHTATWLVLRPIKSLIADGYPWPTS